jgi:hypothetical protein
MMRQYLVLVVFVFVAAVAVTGYIGYGLGVRDGLVTGQYTASPCGDVTDASIAQQLRLEVKDLKAQLEAATYVPPEDAGPPIP